MNAKQLKDSILQYAIQGKIVPQVLNEEPASVLVERIRNEKQQLIKEKIIKKVKINPISEEDILWSVPPTWEWVRAAEVLDVRDGTHDTPKYVQEGIPLVTSKNLKKGKIVFDTIKYISLEDHNEIEKRSKVDTGDILFAMIGTIGNPVLVNKDRDFSVKNVGIFKSYPDNKINMEYVYYYLMYIESLLKKEASGGVQSFVSLTVLRNLMIPIPPLKEQELIVKKINQLLIKVDLFEHTSFTLNNLIEAFPEKLDQSILQYAMQGKLVEQDLKDESVSQLIEQIKEEKSRLIEQKVIKKEKGLPPITEDEIPFEIPETWEWVRLGEISTYIQRGKSPTYSSIEEVPVVSQKCIQWSGFTLEPAKFIDPKTLDKYDEIRFIKNGDLLWNSTGLGTVGRINRYSTKEISFDKVVVDSHVTIVRISELINSEFVYYYLASPQIQESIEEMCTGSTKQKELNTSTIKSVLVPLPPIKEQNRIVKKINQVLSVVDQLK